MKKTKEQRLKTKDISVVDLYTQNLFSLVFVLLSMCLYSFMLKKYEYI